MVGIHHCFIILDNQTTVRFQVVGAYHRQPSIWHNACINVSLYRIHCGGYL